MTEPIDLLAHALTLVPADPQLTEAERHELQLSIQPGRPWYKVLKTSLDYAEHLKDHIVQAELVAGSPDLVQARQLQLKRRAVLDFLDYLGVQIKGGRTPRPAKKE